MSPSSFCEIGTAVSNDTSALAALSIEVWLDTYATRGVSEAFASHVLTTYTPSAFAADLKDPNKRLLVCRSDAGLLGYLKLDLSAEPVSAASGSAEIETLYVRRHHQRMGIGNRLVKEALRLAGEAGHPKLFLTVYEKNVPAISFYEAQGMKYEGSWIFEFEGGAVPNRILTCETGT